MIAPTDRRGHKPSAMVRETLDEQSRGHSGAWIKKKANVQQIMTMIKDLVHDHPGTSLLVALSLGGLAGWFIKRRS